MPGFTEAHPLLLQSILASVADGITVQNRAYQIVFANEAAARFLGFESVEALMATSPAAVTAQFDIMDERGQPLPLAQLPGRLAFEGIEAPEIVVRFRVRAPKEKAGEERWSVLQARPILDERGEVQFAINLFRDITERKRAEQQAEVERRRLQALFENVQDAILIADDSARYVDVNPAAIELTGYSREELLQRGVIDLTPGENVGWKTLWEDFKRVGTQAGQFPILRRDGSKVEVEYHAVSNFVPGLHLSVLRDVTQRRRAEEALIQERTLMRLLIDNLPDLVYVKDRESRFLMNNIGHASLMRALSTEETIGKTDFDFFPSELAQGYYDDEQRIIRTGEPLLDYEETSVRADGSPISVLTTKLPLRDSAGNIIGLVGITRDVSEAKRLEQEREELLRREQAARAEAEAANALKIRFLGMISHELRTPLTSIKGFATTLLADDVEFSPEDQRQFIRIINDEADKLTDLVEQLLSISQLQAGRLRIDAAPHTFAEVLGTSMTVLEMLTVMHEFRVDVPDNLPLLMLDVQRIAQVLVNLVDNAAKYSPPGRRIILAARLTGPFVEVSVADEGEGIPPSDHDQVFEAFRQVALPRGRSPGAGLGLAICKGLVEAHGGRIWIDDPTVRGTRIVFTLPVAESRTAPTGGFAQGQGLRTE